MGEGLAVCDTGSEDPHWSNLKFDYKVLLTPMGVLTAVSVHTQHSSQPPINTSKNISMNVS